MAEQLYISFKSSVNNNDWFQGNTGTDEAMAQTFTPDDTITCTAVEVVIGNQTGETDNVVCSIQTTSSGNPTGTLAHANATVTKAGADIASYSSISNNTYKFTFPGTFSLTASTTYALVLEKSGSRVLSSYAWLILTTNPYSGGDYRSRNSGSWGAGSEGGDAAFGVYRELSSIKEISGVAQASVKKLSGVALASIKKVSGVAN